AEAGREVKGLISYAVGCMLGRYRLDREGLAYAGGTWNADIGQIFPPEKEPFLLLGKDGEKIAGRLEAFLETVYGSRTLEANLTFLAKHLPGNGTPREVIRSYFRNHFYTDHCQMYRKRPIYWLLSSGKKKGFQALFSIHRYHPDLLATLVPHVQKQHQAILTQQAELTKILPTVSYREKAKIRQLQQKLHERSEEIRVWMEKLCPLARQKKTLCLDDGVKQNYALFQDILAKIG
ncbi:MAG: SAM-dependent methyltransferase, partial [Planctomycetia bacterium]|nr:SAM-dependent methyltransferase [Planctomycetia bacterium]